VKLVIIRHGPAGDPDKWEAKGRDDRLRPLTPKGKKEVRRAAAGLAGLVPALDVLATSPLVRAVETAEIVAAEYGCEIETLESLASERDPGEVLPWLQAQPASGTVGLVGHEPHLSTLVGYLVAERKTSFIELKKGGACLLEMDDPPRPGRGTLQWLLTDRELRRLAE
jgi:phosphohistidine phosphatase